MTEDVQERELRTQRDRGADKADETREGTSPHSFDAVKVSLASPDQILQWSHGEITKPETINYRTQRPERDGLFDERIFGPTKDWECYCGKYKRIRYKGVVCDKCGVEVTRSIVRRERMGHIKLVVPVSHIWFVRGIPSVAGLILDMSVRDLERVIYFASFVIEDVDDKAKKEALAEIDKEFKHQREEVTKKYAAELAEAKKTLKEKHKDNPEKLEEELGKLTAQRDEELAQIEETRAQSREDLASLGKGKLIPEQKYRDLSLKYGHVFKAGIGAEAIKRLLESVDLDKMIRELREEAAEGTGQKKKRALKQLRLIEGMKQAKLRPEWAIITILPVIPPDLRPMVQLDGGRFAASDLNDLYRRVINRNNRLKRLIDLDAPEVILRNEKRMLQEAVDALIDNNARRERAVSLAGSRRKYKSLADMLKGKQGRFRQNLLGKRVDYSGRSVIVVGPNLHLSECGIPKMMALELFKPFVIGRLIEDGIAHNVKSASRMIERQRTEVWDALEEVIKDKYVLLNRAPTLHRLGIQAFKPVLIEGKAIQIHPLVCEAYNADFDGDQMAVHVPLSKMAQEEASTIMFSPKNLLKPASGDPFTSPRHEMILGIYYLTMEKMGAKGEGKSFRDTAEAIYAYKLRAIDLRAVIKVRIDGAVVETTVGRIIFNEALPKELSFINERVSKGVLRSIVSECFDRFGEEVTVKLVDELKSMGFKFSTRSGNSISVDDLEVPEAKEAMLEEAEQRAGEIFNQYQIGLITDEERYLKLINLWAEAKEALIAEMMEKMDPHRPVSMMMNSGARGDREQVAQLGAMKGLVVLPSGEIIELPIKSNYKEGFSVLEYFISTHGARKGGVDTALRTADSGYLTRRLVDVAQDVVVIEEDCKDTEGFAVTNEDSKLIGISFSNRLFGRVAAHDVTAARGKVLVKKGEVISRTTAKEIEEAAVEAVSVRSPISCTLAYGICRVCYGLDLSKGHQIALGEAIGIIAAQSIGEPGTQLTMRTFHTGGVVGLDITQGLPRVEELFEARIPKGQAVVAEISGKIKIDELENRRVITIASGDVKEDSYALTATMKPLVKKGENVTAKQALAQGTRAQVRARYDGVVREVQENTIVVQRLVGEVREYTVPYNVQLKIADGESVEAGEQLTEGPLNLQDLFKLRGQNEAQRYLIREIQQIYISQGQGIHDKHIEVIVRQMFSRVRVEEAGDSSFITGQIVSRTRFQEEVARLKKEGGKVPTGETLLLPITKVALSTDSYLSAASFMETTRVLINAAVKGDIDYLRGLKENVIVGRLIPVGTGYKKPLEPIKKKLKKN